MIDSQDDKKQEREKEKISQKRSGQEENLCRVTQLIPNLWLPSRTRFQDHLMHLLHRRRLCGHHTHIILSQFQLRRLCGCVKKEIKTEEREKEKEIMGNREGGRGRRREK
jgi:hypothetical protein